MEEKKVGWVAWEYVGCEVKRDLETKQADRPLDLPSITDRNSLKVGDKILVGTLFGWVRATVRSVEEDRGEAETDRSLFPLEFGGDDRKCWVCGSEINKSALQKLKFWEG